MLIHSDFEHMVTAICSALDYKGIGIPSTDADVLAFKDYRDSKELGSIIVTSVTP